MAALDATLEGYIASSEVTRPSDKQPNNTLDEAREDLGSQAQAVLDQLG